MMTGARQWPCSVMLKQWQSKGRPTQKTTGNAALWAWMGYRLTKGRSSEEVLWHD